MTALHHQSLVRAHHLQVFHDELILHPVLADLAGLAISHELIRIKGDIKIQIVVDHHLQGAGRSDTLI